MAKTHFTHYSFLRHLIYKQNKLKTVHDLGKKMQKHQSSLNFALNAYA